MDTRSINNINTLHPKYRPSVLAAWAEAQAAMPANVQIIVIKGLRSFAESNQLWRQGRDANGNVIDQNAVVTNAPAGESYHNYGLAFDFAMVTNGKDDYTVGPHWIAVVLIMKKHGMAWGGDFLHLKDDPHFENRYGYNWRGLLAKHNAGDFIPGTTFVAI